MERLSTYYSKDRLLFIVSASSGCFASALYAFAGVLNLIESFWSIERNCVLDISPLHIIHDVCLSPSTYSSTQACTFTGPKLVFKSKGPLPKNEEFFRFRAPSNVILTTRFRDKFVSLKVWSWCFSVLKYDWVPVGNRSWWGRPKWFGSYFWAPKFAWVTLKSSQVDWISQLTNIVRWATGEKSTPQ